MKKIVLATVLAALGSASALAADLAPRAYSKAPMMAAPVSTCRASTSAATLGMGGGEVIPAVLASWAALLILLPGVMTQNLRASSAGRRSATIGRRVRSSRS